MANLTATTPRTYQILPSTLDYPIAGTSTIFEGSALSDTGSATVGTGVAQNLLGTETFLGFASQTVLANSGITTVTCNVEGVIQLAVTGVTAASTGVTVYASDGNTFTTTSTSNSAVGKVIKVISGTTCLVKYQGLGYRSI